MYLKKAIFLGITIILLSSCGGDSGGDDNSENKKPTVNAGLDKSVKVNENISIVGTANDSDGLIVRYEWKEGDTFLANTLTFNFLPTVTGSHTLTLSVTDDDGATATDTVIVMATEETDESETPLTASLSKGLIVHYKFEGNAKDSSGNGNDGVEYGDVNYTDGAIGESFNAKVENKAYFQLKNTFDTNTLKSLSFWIYQYGKHDLDDSQILLSKYNWSHKHNFIFTTYDKTTTDLNRICASFYVEFPDKTSKSDKICSYYDEIPKNDNLTLYKNQQIDMNKWTHIVYLDDGTYMYLYLNNELVVKKKRIYQAYFSDDEPINMGYEDLIGSDFIYNYYLNSKIDDFRIYNRALDKTEIAELYKMGNK